MQNQLTSDAVRQIADDAIRMFLEYLRDHEKTEGDARYLAVREVVEGFEAKETIDRFYAEEAAKKD